MSAARRGTRPRGLWAGRHEAEGDGAEQRTLRAARRQLNADAGCERELNPPHLWVSNFPQFRSWRLTSRGMPREVGRRESPRCCPLGGRERRGGQTRGTHDDLGPSSAGIDRFGDRPPARHGPQDDPPLHRTRPGAADLRPTAASIRSVAGFATCSGSAGHAGATASIKLTFHLGHSMWAAQWDNEGLSTRSGGATVRRRGRIRK